MTVTTEPTLAYDDVANAVAGGAVAIRAVTVLQPAGGEGDKVFPPTYQGGQYHIETRRVGESEVETVVLDSVQSQANRMELALLEARERGLLEFPLIVADFSTDLPHIGRITALEAPHRIADAIFRDSLYDGVRFRESGAGRRFTSANIRNATSLLELCPTALVFGVWDSTGPRGGLGAKFARVIASEIVGFDVVVGHKTGSRIDPLPIARGVEIYASSEGGWTLDPASARKTKKGDAEKLRPSELNLGNVTPDLARGDRGAPLPGGVTMSRAVQTTVLSLAALRKLGFPVGEVRSHDADGAARSLLTALGVAAIVFQREHGYDLRSRCLLVPTGSLGLELVSPDGGATAYSLDASGASDLVARAADAARSAGFVWGNDEIALTPEPKLVGLVKRSEELLAQAPDEDDGAAEA